MFCNEILKPIDKSPIIDFILLNPLNDFNFLLDNLKTGTIKNLYSIYELNQGATNGNE